METTAMIDELESMLGSVDAKISDSKDTLSAKFERLVDVELDSKLGAIESELNSARQSLLEQVKERMIGDLCRAAETSPPIDVFYLSKPRADVDSIRHNWLLELDYSNRLSIQKKFAYSNLLGPPTRKRINLSQHPVGVISRNKFLCFSKDEKEFSVVDVKGNVLCRRQATKYSPAVRKRAYQVIEVFGKHIVVTGIFQASDKTRNVFVEVYDLSLRRRARRTFLVHDKLVSVSIQRSNGSSFVHSFPLRKGTKYTIYDFDLNELVSFQDSNDPNGPFFIHSCRIVHYTDRRLFVFGYDYFNRLELTLREFDLLSGELVCKSSLPIGEGKELHFDQDRASSLALVYDFERGSLLLLDLLDEQVLDTMSSDLFECLFSLRVKNDEIFNVYSGEITTF